LKDQHVPRYSTPEHELNEQMIAARVVDAWKLSRYLKDPDPFAPIDFRAYRADRLVGLFEIKCRRRFFFPLWVKLHTVVSIYRAECLTQVPAVLVFHEQQSDGLFYVRPSSAWTWTSGPDGEPRPQTRIERCGRTDRNDPTDITDNVMISAHELQPIRRPEHVSKESTV
jgi:hypothetical protein